MSDLVSEIFGYVVIFVAVLLFAWEYKAFGRRGAEDAWLVTSRRFKRRTLVSIVLLFVGVLLVVETRGYLDIRDPRALVAYVSVLGGLAIALLILAALDLLDIARKASSHAMREFGESLDSEQRQVLENLDREHPHT